MATLQHIVKCTSYLNTLSIRRVGCLPFDISLRLLSNHSTMATFDPIHATAADLQQLLEGGKLTSVEIVEKYLQQIEKYNHAGPRINALLAVAPKHILISTALALDKERASGKLRGPYHGIPIILKVLTHPQISKLLTNCVGQRYVSSRARDADNWRIVGIRKRPPERKRINYSEVSRCWIDYYW